MTRTHLIDKLEISPYNNQLDYLKAIKSCLVLEDHDQDIDDWFQGCIESLFYRPNQYCLVLIGENTSGFIKELFPGYVDYQSERIKIYDSFITDVSIVGKLFFESISTYLKGDQFKVTADSYEKRLTSFCSSVDSWRFPQRKRFITLRVKSINWDFYHYINKEELWAHLFHKYKIIRS